MANRLHKAAENVFWKFSPHRKECCLGSFEEKVTEVTHEQRIKALERRLQDLAEFSKESNTSFNCLQEYCEAEVSLLQQNYAELHKAAYRMAISSICADVALLLLTSGFLFYIFTH